MVVSFNMGCPLDLRSIAMRARNSEFNPKRFGACILRIREPRTTAMLFASGRGVVTGARSEEDARLATRRVRA